MNQPAMSANQQDIPVLVGLLFCFRNESAMVNGKLTDADHDRGVDPESLVLWSVALDAEVCP